MANTTDYVMTPKFRARWVHVFDKVENQRGDLQHEITMIFPADADLSAMKKIVREAAAMKWGTNLPEDLNTPFRKGSEKADKYEEFEGSIFCKANTQHDIVVVDQNTDPINDGVYDGCYARCKVCASAYDVNGNKGVKFYLGNVQKMADGEKLRSGASAGDDFTVVEGATPKTSVADEEDDFFNV